MTSLLRLKEHINQQILRPVTPAIKTLSEYLLTAYEKRIAAILFYGSCLRTGDDRGGMVGAARDWNTGEHLNLAVCWPPLINGCHPMSII